jgi:hypothetical protein
MSFVWRGCFEVAQALADGRPAENTEAALRTAIGRAYSDPSVLLLLSLICPMLSLIRIQHGSVRH